MPLARWQGHILDDGGNIVQTALISVRREAVGLPLATIYSDRDGVTPLSNPFNAGSDGYVAFHAAGGAYRIVATKGAFNRQWTYVPIGLAQESDQVPTSPLREVLAANRTIYVRVSGNDSTGNGSLVAPYATVQKGADVAAQLDTSIYAVTIDIGAGTYAEAVQLKPPVGGGRILFSGAGATTIVQPSAGHCFSASSGGLFRLANMKLQKPSGGTGHGISVSNGAIVEWTGINFGACTGRHVFASSSGVALCVGSYTISGGALYHWAQQYGYVQCVNQAVTLSGTPDFTSFAYSLLPGSIHVNGTTYSGSATGQRYSADSNGVIYTLGATLPGNSAGAETNGGEYI